MSSYDHVQETSRPSQDSPFRFFRVFAGEFLTLVKLNLLFLLFCLPLVTFGPALAALTELALQLWEGRSPHVLKSFCALFRRYCRRCFLPGLLALCLTGAVCAAGVLYLQMVLSDPIFYVPLFFFSAVCFLLGLSSVYFFPLLVRTDLPLPAVCKNALLMGLAGLRLALAAFMVKLVLFVLIIAYLPWTFPLFLFLLFSTAVLLNAFAAGPDLEARLTL